MKARRFRARRRPHSVYFPPRTRRATSGSMGRQNNLASRGVRRSADNGRYSHVSAMLQSRTPDMSTLRDPSRPPTRCRGRHGALPSNRRNTRFCLHCSRILTPSLLCFALSLASYYADGTLRPGRSGSVCGQPPLRFDTSRLCQCSDRIPSQKSPFADKRCTYIDLLSP